MKYFVLALALLAACSVRGQGLPPDRENEALAQARLTAAAKLPRVTHAQCSVLLAKWQDRDKADGSKTKGFWYEMLSTEELARLSALSLACRKPATNNAEKLAFSLYNEIFKLQLLLRAETVLRDHGLLREYLLQPTR